MVLLALTSISCNQSDPPQRAQLNPTPEAQSDPTPEAQLRLNNDNWHLALAEAKGAQKAYLGSNVVIRGKVSQVVGTSGSQSQFTIQTNADAIVGERTLIAVRTNPGVTEDQWVRVEGLLNSYFNTQNLLGSEIRLPVVFAHNVTVITRADAVPSILTVLVDQNITRHGLTITLERLEVADSETRLYISAKNDSPNNASLYTYDAVLVQGTRQIKSKTLFGQDIGEPDTTLVSGTETQGVLLYEPVSPVNSPIKLIWQGPRTDDYSLTFPDWEWVISW